MGRAVIGNVRFELDRYPVITLRLPARGEVAGVHTWYDEVERLLREADGPLGFVHDLRAVDLLTSRAPHRLAVAERTKRLAEAPFARKLAADARIASSGFAVGAITAVTWLTGRMPWPQATFVSEAQAVEWTLARIAEAARASRV